jgi:hypothetical protein
MPEKYRGAARTTRPAFGAFTGVPAGLLKSAPPCWLRGSPLNTLCVPNALLAACTTGRANAPAHSRSPAEAFQIASSSRASRAIRSAASGGGVTNVGSTVSVRVRKGRFVTVMG